MPRRLDPEEDVVFRALKAKREEMVSLVERIDVAGDADAESQRANAIHSIDEGVGLALRTLTRSRD